MRRLGRRFGLQVLKGMLIHELRGLGNALKASLAAEVAASRGQCHAPVLPRRRTHSRARCRPSFAVGSSIELTMSTKQSPRLVRSSMRLTMSPTMSHLPASSNFFSISKVAAGSRALEMMRSLIALTAMPLSVSMMRLWYRGARPRRYEMACVVGFSQDNATRELNHAGAPLTLFTARAEQTVSPYAGTTLLNVL